MKKSKVESRYWTTVKVVSLYTEFALALRVFRSLLQAAEKKLKVQLGDTCGPSCRSNDHLLFDLRR